MNWKMHPRNQKKHQQEIYSVVESKRKHVTKSNDTNKLYLQMAQINPRQFSKVNYMIDAYA